MLSEGRPRMNRQAPASIGLALLAAAFTLLATQPPALAEAPLDPALAALQPFVGKTWKGEVGRGKDEPPKTDVQTWQVALGGKAVRIRHAFTDGSYGGETLVMWDAEKHAFVYVYFTTGGFYTQGTMSFDGRTFTAREEVHGRSDGVTAVETKGELLPDGSLYSKARYLKDGEWVAGRESRYSEAPDALVELD